MKLKNTIVYHTILIFLTLPSISSAAAWCDATDDCSFDLFVTWAISSILKPIIPVVVSLTVAIFLWGTAQYIMYGDDIEKRKVGRRKMLIGIISLAIMMSFWGLAKMLVGTFF